MILFVVPSCPLPAVFSNYPLRNDVADQIVQRRVGDLDLDDVACRGRAVIDVDDPVDLRSQPCMASL